MRTHPIVMKVERSSLGTFQARAARRSISPSAAAKVVARAEAERKRDETRRSNLGGHQGADTYT